MSFDHNKRAEEIMRESHGRLNIEEARQELSRRGHERRKFKNYGVLHVTNSDRRAFKNVEAGPRFWWQDL